MISSGEPLLRFETPIHTERLILRTLTPDDLDDFESYAARPDVIRYLPWPLRNRAEIAEQLSKRLGTTLEKSGDTLVLGIELPAPGAAAADGTAADGTVTSRTASDGTAASRATTGSAERAPEVKSHPVYSDETDEGLDAAPSADGQTDQNAAGLASGAASDIAQAGSGRLIGDLTLRLTSAEDNQAEIGWVLHPDFQGNGFAFEAALRLLHIAFDDLGAHRVVAHLDAENNDSARLCHRLGLRLEGRFVHDHRDEDTWADSLVFAILDAEWKARTAIDGR